MNNYVVLSVISFTIVLLLLIAGVVLVLMLARKRKIEAELKEVVYENQLNRAELASLRAQMNPHFVFNCLNSIRLLTEKKETDAASEYLDKFSRLIRNNLEQARSEYNTLRFEIQTLRLYLEMESLRIKEQVSWEIHCDEDTDIDNTEIPSMFLQPFVENAIWHGLMHKADPGHLQIIFREEADSLLVTIEDNGIGRAAAARIKEARSSTHDSLATKINEERMQRMSRREENPLAAMQIIDLFDDSGAASGTRVEIRFPLD